MADCSTSGILWSVCTFLQIDKNEHHFLSMQKKVSELALETFSCLIIVQLAFW